MMAEQTTAGPDRVTLRDVVEDDLPILYTFQLDQESNQMAAFTARDRDAFMQHWARLLGNPAIVKQTILCDGQVAGNIGCFEMEGDWEVTYWIGREFWGRGIATRALAALLEQVKTRPLYGYTATHNIASRRVLEKCGFTFFGEHPAIMTLHGEDVPGYILKLNAGDRAT
jgi:RimJ/RimL family protein N-acetyltransferase